MKRLVCIILIVTILVSGLVFVRTTHATSVGGTLNDNTHWTLMDSPVTFNQTVIVASNATLTIDPGVTVNMGMYSLTVYGTLMAEGTSGNQIIFSSGVSYTDFITFNTNYLTNSSLAAVSASIIQNAVLNDIALQFYSESPTLDSCTINLGALYYSPSAITINEGSPTISNNVISYTAQSENQNINLISVTGGTSLITNNTLQGNYPGSASNDIMVYSGNPTITSNTFSAVYTSSNDNGITVNSGATPQISNNQFNGNGYLTAIVASKIIYGYSSNGPTAFTISNNVFSRCNVGVKAESGNGLMVVGNSFLGGTDGVDVASSATITISDNLIDSNSRYGIDGSGYINSNTITNNKIGIHNPLGFSINDNNIVGNTEYSITTSTTNVDASNNWWGTTDAPTINQTIYDGKVDPSLGNATFVPYLLAPNTSAPAIPNTTPIITPIPTQVPPPTITPPPATPIPTPYQYSQSFIYQIGTVINLNTIATLTAIALILVWVIVILGYTAKSGIKKIPK
jgi:hypothetical protein